MQRTAPKIKRSSVKATPKPAHGPPRRGHHKLTRAQILAGFGGKAAQHKAQHGG